MAKKKELSEKLKIGQKIKVIRKPLRASEIETGDTAFECGYTNLGLFEGQHQFHSKKLVNESKRGENYWVEFLPRHCYKLLKEQLQEL